MTFAVSKLDRELTRLAESVCGTLLQRKCRPGGVGDGCAAAGTARGEGCGGRFAPCRRRDEVRAGRCRGAGGRAGAGCLPVQVAGRGAQGGGSPRAACGRRGEDAGPTRAGCRRRGVHAAPVGARGWPRGAGCGVAQARCVGWKETGGGSDPGRRWGVIFTRPRIFPVSSLTAFPRAE